eukprot:TRINITY_DN1209_c0_g1_i1.p1 TRINITY_DN1209_c0_g1~~TRINITY_DN1209_c0_g1_i1.p1  ORF type:complete len:169 (+),score=14.97 TRINITY_DN1209_c0_g1_i1:160-666(+)
MALGLGRGLLAPLLFFIFIMTIIQLALAGWAMNRYIDGRQPTGNDATIWFLLLSLISGVVGLASVFAATHHTRVWRTDSLAAAGATALIDFFISVLALGLAAKEIHIGGRDRRLRVLEGFVISVTVFKLLKLMALHAGVLGDKYGPTYGQGHHAIGDHHKGTSAAAAV